MIILAISDNGTLFLGCSGNSARNGFASEFVGQITDFNIWSRKLSLEDMIQFTKCKAFLNKEYQLELNWESEKWINQGVDIIDLDLEDMCRSNERQFHIFEPNLNVWKAKDFCSSIGGTLAMPRNRDEISRVLELMRKSVSLIICVDNSIRYLKYFLSIFGNKHL